MKSNRKNKILIVVRLFEQKVTLADDNGNIGIFVAFLRLGVLKDLFVG